MKQLNVFCEGQTEGGFCRQVLQPHLFPQGDGIIHSLAVGEKDHRHLYGGIKYQRIRKFILNTIKNRQASDVLFTTMFDLYALPKDFPGVADDVLNAANPTPYVLALEAAFANDIDHHRFVPHLQLYEYETILFADPEAFAFTFENWGTRFANFRRLRLPCLQSNTLMTAETPLCRSGLFR
jgi:hypothetical protein